MPRGPCTCQTSAASASDYASVVLKYVRHTVSRMVVVHEGFLLRAALGNALKKRSYLKENRGVHIRCAKGNACCFHV